MSPNKFPYLLLCLLLVLGCAEGPKQAQKEVDGDMPISQVLGPDEFKALLDKTANPQLIDVRTAAEVSQGVLAGASHICFSCPGFREAIGELDKETPVFLYCKVGGRSAKTASMMKDMGFKEVYDLKGGIIEWQAAGYKLDLFRHGKLPPAD